MHTQIDLYYYTGHPLADYAHTCVDSERAEKQEVRVANAAASPAKSFWNSAACCHVTPPSGQVQSFLGNVRGRNVAHRKNLQQNVQVVLLQCFHLSRNSRIETLMVPCEAVAGQKVTVALRSISRDAKDYRVPCWRWKRELQRILCFKEADEVGVPAAALLDSMRHLKPSLRRLKLCNV